MKQAPKHLIRLYPAAWRKRYAVEFEALLEQTHPNWMTLVDVLKGAFSMQLVNWTFPRLTVACALAGALFATVVAYTRPEQFRSEALLLVTPQGNGDAGQAIRNAETEALSRSALTQIINTFNLYQGERSRMPIEDVIDNMREHIGITPVQGTSGYVVRFVYPDRRLANYVVDNLVGRLIMANVKPSTANAMFELIDPASLSQRPEGLPRPARIFIGLLTGALLGITAFFIWSQRRKYVPCPTCGHRMALTVSPQTAGESAGRP